jgi:transposase-like protein
MLGTCCSPSVVQRLEQMVSRGDVASALEVNPNLLHRWLRKVRQGWATLIPE